VCTHFPRPTISKRINPRPTFNPFNALLPFEKKLSFANKSSCRMSAPAKLSMTYTNLA